MLPVSFLHTCLQLDKFKQCKRPQHIALNESVDLNALPSETKPVSDLSCCGHLRAGVCSRTAVCFVGLNVHRDHTRSVRDGKQLHVSVSA